jgi:hypothetical protein
MFDSRYQKGNSLLMFIDELQEITLHTADGSVWDNPSGFL